MGKKYRIAIDARLYEETGVGRYIKNLTASLARIDSHNQYLLLLRKKTYDRIILPAPNFRKILADTRWHTPWEQIHIPYLIWRQKIDLVHFPYQNFVPALFCPAKFVLTVHDLIIAKLKTGRFAILPSFFTNIKQFFFSTLLRVALARACKIIAVSEATKKTILQLFASSAPIDVIYEANGLSLSQKRIKAPALGEYFLYVGSAHPHKNLQVLIEAFRKANLERVKLILVGKDDFFYPRLKRELEDRGLMRSERIEILGEKSDEELIGLYQNALAVVLPSKAEGFGLPAIEAMTLGCLVLASKIEVFQEICADAAVYFDPDDVESLSRTLVNIAGVSTNYDLLRTKGTKRAAMFSWDLAARQTLTIYERCLSLRSR